MNILELVTKINSFSQEELDNYITAISDILADKIAKRLMQLEAELQLETERMRKQNDKG